MSHNLSEPQFSHLYNGNDDGASKCGSVPCRKMIQNISLPLVAGPVLWVVSTGVGGSETLVTFSQPITFMTQHTLMGISHPAPRFTLSPPRGRSHCGPTTTWAMSKEDFLHLWDVGDFLFSQRGQRRKVKIPTN